MKKIMIPDSQYLDMLAHWFEQMRLQNKFGISDSVTPEEHLRRIAAKLRIIEHSTGFDDVIH